MPRQSNPITIKDADPTPDGVIITFSDGLTALYHTDFLYDLRNSDGNVLLMRPRPDRKP